jgi:hypothetical protein
MSESTSGGWLTVAQASAALGIGERAVQKRCEAGKINARRTVTPQGARWEINPNEITRTPERTNEPDEPKTPEPANQKPETDSFAVQNHPPERTEPANEPNRTTEREAELKAEVIFLRGVVEAQNRDAAELRAALREALKISNRALVESTSTEALQGDLSGQSTLIAQVPPVEAKAPQTGTEREEKGNQSTLERQRGFRGWLLKVLREK